MLPALTSGGWYFRDSSEWQHLCLVLLSFQPRHPHPAALGLWQWGLRDNAESWKDESIHSFPWIPGDVMLGVDILHSQGGRNKGCLYAAAGSKPGMEPLWMPPPWSRERGRAETEITTRTGRFHATSLDCLCQTTNNITMLQQNFSAPSPGRHKIHQKCWWPALEIFLSWLAYNKTCRISFLLLLIFVGIFFSSAYLALKAEAGAQSLHFHCVNQVQFGPRTQGWSPVQAVPAQPGFHRHLAFGSVESNLKTTGNSEK